jgi:hypothetical protein
MLVQPFFDAWAVGALAVDGVAAALLAVVFAFDFELPQPEAASGTSTRIGRRARCRTARKASDAP